MALSFTSHQLYLTYQKKLILRLIYLIENISKILKLNADVYALGSALTRAKKILHLYIHLKNR